MSAVNKVEGMSFARERAYLNTSLLSNPSSWLMIANQKAEKFPNAR